VAMVAGTIRATLHDPLGASALGPTAAARDDRHAPRTEQKTRTRGEQRQPPETERRTERSSGVSALLDVPLQGWPPLLLLLLLLAGWQSVRVPVPLRFRSC
jgi:hypothetical protein